jgi:hypothetical protein
MALDGVDVTGTKNNVTPGRVCFAGCDQMVDTFNHWR